MNKFLAILALAAIPFTAFAHGPTPQKVEKSIVIKAPPAKVWAMVKDFGNMHVQAGLVGDGKPRRQTQHAAA